MKDWAAIHEEIEHWSLPCQDSIARSFKLMLRVDVQWLACIVLLLYPAASCVVQLALCYSQSTFGRALAFLGVYLPQRASLTSSLLLASSFVNQLFYGTF